MAIQPSSPEPCVSHVRGVNCCPRAVSRSMCTSQVIRRVCSPVRPQAYFERTSAVRWFSRLFPDSWWGITVFTCFGAERGTQAVAHAFQHPLPGPAAKAVLATIPLPAGAIGHHRIQPGHTGARKALIAASDNVDLFHDVLTGIDTFEQRYHQIRSASLPQWGRTTTFDLILRAGALSVSGQRYRPTTAFLEGSTGPRRGFERIFAVNLHEHGADWGEALLHAWTTHWSEVATQVGVDWDEAPYDSGDFENALCIYQVILCRDSDEGERRYYRFQAELDIGSDDMDNATATNINALKQKAKQIIKANSAALNTLCDQLTALAATPA